MNSPILIDTKKPSRLSYPLPNNPQPTTPNLKLRPPLLRPRSSRPARKHNLQIPLPLSRRPFRSPFHTIPLFAVPIHLLFLDQCNPTSDLVRPYQTQGRRFEILVRGLGVRTGGPAGEEVLLVVQC